MRNPKLLQGFVLTALFVVLLPFQVQAFRIERVSVASDESESNGYSGQCNLSQDGKFIAFNCGANNLVTGDTENYYDIFVRDLVNGTTERISVTNADPSIGANSHSEYPSISAYGRYVAFHTTATNIMATYSGGYSNVYVRDRLTATTEIASKTATGTPGYGGNGDSSSPSLSSDGQYAAFESNATDLGPGGGGSNYDIFVRDLTGAATTLVSQSSPGYGGNDNSWDPSISGDGRYVAFESRATNLANRDFNVWGLYYDIWVWDRQDSSITLVSRGSYIGGYYGGYGGDSYDPSISADGRYVAFTSNASNLVPGVNSDYTDIFVRDLVNNTTSLVSVGSGGYGGNNASDGPVISQAGRYVVFDSGASDLVPDDDGNHQDVFVRDLKRGKTVLVSKNRSGEQGNSFSGAYGGGLSSDGRYVAFGSDASNLVDSDENTAMDVFMASGFFPVGLPSMFLLLGE
jgi:Tol biopolymer transport system component